MRSAPTAMKRRTIIVAIFGAAIVNIVVGAFVWGILQAF